VNCVLAGVELEDDAAAHVGVVAVDTELVEPSGSMTSYSGCSISSISTPRASARIWITATLRSVSSAQSFAVE